MGSKSRQHTWGNPDADGVRACNNAGCTVRVADSFRVWQRRKGGHWKKQVRELIPECTGGEVPMKPEPAALVAAKDLEATRLDRLIRALTESCPTPCACPAHAALATLVEKAQEHEAAVAAMDEDGADSQVGTSLADRIEALSEDRISEKVRAERAEEERSAAVSTNAVLLSFVREQASVVCEEAPGTECGSCTSCLARLHVAQPHPGAAFLKERKEQNERLKQLEQVARLAADTAERPMLREMAAQALGPTEGLGEQHDGVVGAFARLCVTLDTKAYQAERALEHIWAVVGGELDPVSIARTVLAQAHSLRQNQEQHAQALGKVWSEAADVVAQRRRTLEAIGLRPEAAGVLDEVEVLLRARAERGGQSSVSECSGSQKAGLL